MAGFSRFVLASCLLAGLLVGVLTTSARSDSGPVYSGQATALKGQIVGIPVGPFGDTGFQQGSAFSAQSSLDSASVDGVSAYVLHGTTIAGGDQVNSEASLANVSVGAAGQSVSADFVMARANATCTTNGPVVSGSSELVGLMVNGGTIAVTGQPNQTIPLPGGGSVVINEQSQSTSGSNAQMTVNALHVIVPATLVLAATDLVFSSAHADVQGCPPGGKPAPSLCPAKDFTTGGGFVTANGAKGHFVIAAGLRSNADGWGHTRFRGLGVVLNATTIGGYGGSGLTRSWSGLADVNGSPGHSYQVTAIDNGEPGSLDHFTLVVDGSQVADGNLAGGNIQLHCK